MTQFDQIYKDIVNEILTTGTSSHFYGGVRTKYDRWNTCTLHI